LSISLVHTFSRLSIGVAKMLSAKLRYGATNSPDVAPDSSPNAPRASRSAANVS
jgi:hypothetical protein